MRGWVRTGALIAVIALLGAVVVWVVITQHVGHLLLDGGAAPWPELSSGLGTWLIIGPVMAAFLLWGLLTWAGVWTRGLGLDGGTGTLAGTAAVALGSGAAAAGAGGGTPGLVLGAVAACFLVICVWRAVRLRREVRASVAVLDERARVRAEGLRVRAEVTEVRFMHTWIGSSASFHVVAKAEVERGTLTAVDTLSVEPEAAPVVGGTVHALYDPADPSTVVMEVDDASIRDPEAGKTYASPTDF